MLSQRPKNITEFIKQYMSTPPAEQWNTILELFADPDYFSDVITCRDDFYQLANMLDINRNAFISQYWHICNKTRQKDLFMTSNALIELRERYPDPEIRIVLWHLTHYHPWYSENLNALCQLAAKFPNEIDDFFRTFKFDVKKYSYSNFRNEFLKLIVEGASNEILEKSFITFSSQTYGKMLKFIPTTLPQHGPNCGYYAVYNSAKFLQQLHPQLFSQKILLPRKKDVTPKATSSLREKGKKFIQSCGAIYSTQELIRVIELTGCKGVEHSYHSSSEFYAIIKNAIAYNFPIILPYSTGGIGSQSGSGTDAFNTHWTMIFGYIENPLNSKADLMTIYTTWNTQVQFHDANTLYNDCTNLETELAVMYHNKRKGGEWDSSLTPSEPQPDVKSAPHKNINLLPFFKQKLVVVKPPGHETVPHTAQRQGM